MITSYPELRSLHLAQFKQANPSLRHHAQLAGDLHALAVQEIADNGIDWMLRLGPNGVIQHLSQKVRRTWFQTIIDRIFGSMVQRILEALLPILIQWIIAQLQNFLQGDVHSELRNLAAQSRS